MSLFGEAQIEAAREARRQLVADIRLVDLENKDAFNRKLTVVMLEAAESALDLEQLVEAATRAVAGEDWAQMSTGVRDGIRRDTRIVLAAIGLRTL